MGMKRLIGPHLVSSMVRFFVADYDSGLISKKTALTVKIPVTINKGLM